MLSQKILSQLDSSKSKIIQQTDCWHIIVTHSSWLDWDCNNKSFWVYTQVFHNYTDFIISLLWQKVKIEYIDDGEYEDIKDWLI